MKKLIWVLLLALCIAVPAGAALVNVSEGKTATASASYGGTNPASVVDGVTDLGHPNHWHSANGDLDPWWMVDLGEVSIIKEIVLWNRVDCCQLRLQDITVEILDPAQGVGYKSALLNPGNELSGPASITLTLGAPTPGQFVRVTRISSAPTSHDTYAFALAEVEVFADTDAATPAWGPLPGLGAVDVALDTTLLWNTSVRVNPDNTSEVIPNPEVIKHVVYLSQDSSDANDFVAIAQIDAGDPVDSIGETDALALVRDAVYFWRIDEIIIDSNDKEVAIEGNVWSFASETSAPVVGPVEPAELLIDPGEVVEYNVTAINPITEDDTGLSYQWFKVGVVDDVALAGENSTTFAIADPNETHDGLYYCVVTTDSTGVSANSSQGLLITKRLMHHWPFEGTMEDVVGGFDGVAIGDPDLSVEGISGNYAVDLDGDDAIYIGEGDGLIYKFSISAWINHRGLPGAAGSFHSLIHQDGWSTNSMHWHLRGDESFSWGINGAGGDGRTSAGVVADPDRWYHLVISYDNGLARAYIDGEMKAEVMASNPIPIRFLPGTIGAWNNGGTYQRFLNGKVDDVRIYNYPVQPIDLAYLYHDVTGEDVCVQELKPEFDLNDDCVANLVDIAILASNWMECLRVPASQCE